MPSFGSHRRGRLTFADIKDDENLVTIIACRALLSLLSACPVDVQTGMWPYGIGEGRGFYRDSGI